MRLEGHPAEWASGTPYAGKGSLSGAARGFYTGMQWEGHAWVVSGDIVIDITADQFGCDPIVITTVFDTRYVESIDLADPTAIKARHETIAALLPEWTGFRSNFTSSHKF
ncbi:hypothetical protein IAE29_24935 [Ochrobactrum sp. S46]|nr:hypothetical protein [Ochrobactrum sp. S45]MBK0046539.1 hypothetical protein [Ochrobactrum sp. S46]